MNEYAIIFTLSTQVTEDSWRVLKHVLRCTPATTLAEIMQWRDAFGKGASPISLEITTLEAPQDRL